MNLNKLETNDVFKYTTFTYNSNTTPAFCPFEHLFPSCDFKGDPLPVNPYALDIWACGIILFELVLLYY